MHPRDVENSVNKYSLYVENAVKGLVAGKFADAQGPNLLNKLYNLMCLASTIRELNSLLRNKFRDSGGTNLLIKNCVSKDPRLQYSSARLLVECLDPASLDYVVQHGLIKVMHVVHAYRRQEQSTVVHSKVSTGNILCKHIPIFFFFLSILNIFIENTFKPIKYFKNN